MEKKQFDLFGELVQKDWEKEWKDMPEFIQEDKGPVKQLIISFKNFDDYKEFSKLINQSLTKKTQSIWFPEAEIERLMDKRWITKDES